MKMRYAILFLFKLNWNNFPVTKYKSKKKICAKRAYLVFFGDRAFKNIFSSCILMMFWLFENVFLHSHSNHSGSTAVRVHGQSLIRGKEAQTSPLHPRERKYRQLYLHCFRLLDQTETSGPFMSYTFQNNVNIQLMIKFKS